MQTSIIYLFKINVHILNMNFLSGKQQRFRTCVRTILGVALVGACLRYYCTNIIVKIQYSKCRWCTISCGKRCTGKTGFTVQLQAACFEVLQQDCVLAFVWLASAMPCWMTVSSFSKQPCSVMLASFLKHYPGTIQMNESLVCPCKAKVD